MKNKNIDIVLTPIKLAEEMFKNITFSKFDDVLKLTVCDGACKDISFIMTYINIITSIVEADKLRYAKYNFKDTLAIQQHILLNCIYGFWIHDENVLDRYKNILSYTYHIDVNKINNIYKYNIIENEISMKKLFDICVMNPPYPTGFDSDSYLSVKFLEKSFNIADISLSVMPVQRWLGKRKLTRVTKFFDEFGGDIRIINSEEFFDAGIQGELSINYCNTTIKSDLIFNGKKYISTKDINLNDNLTLKSFDIDFVTKLYSKDNVWDHFKYGEFDKPTKYLSFNTKVEYNPNNDWWIIRIPSQSIHSTIIAPKQNMDYHICQYKDDKNVKFYIPFDNRSDIINFFNYIRTDFCRACFLLTQSNKDKFVISGALKTVPWFDFSKEIFSHTPSEIDDYLFKKYNIPNDIRKHIEMILPDYYNIRNKK